MDFEFLFGPVEGVDEWLTGLFDGAPLLVALGIAFLLGLRHASDPDHLVAVTSLVAADDGDTARAIWKWACGEYRAGRHAHAAPSDAPPDESHRHLRRSDAAETHAHRAVR